MATTTRLTCLMPSVGHEPASSVPPYFQPVVNEIKQACSVLGDGPSRSCLALFDIVICSTHEKGRSEGALISWIRNDIVIDESKTVFTTADTSTKRKRMYRRMVETVEKKPRDDVIKNTFSYYCGRYD